MTMPANQALSGLGLRRGLVNEWRSLESEGFADHRRPDFIEITPENWLGMGGRFGRDLAFFTERYPVVAHGLSISIGGPDDLDLHFIDRLGAFLDQHRVSIFSEHLSYCTDGGHLYDLMPIPFTEGAVNRIAERVSIVQDRLKRRIALENVSYYAAPGQEMAELDFINEVLEKSDCDLLLDVNNVWVNSVNHNYDPYEFISGLPAEKVAYQHVAGHFVETEDLIIDTHGAPVVESVWSLLKHANRKVGRRPTLLERDFNLPPMPDLLAELDHMGGVIAGASENASEGAETAGYKPYSGRSATA